jgi:hypothetical protein
MVLSIVIAILLLSVILAGIGAYIVINNSDEKEKPLSIIDVSGQYAVLVRPVRQSMEERKPALAEVEAWLATQSLDDAERARYLAAWKEAYEETVRVVDEGDKNGTVTYRIVLSEAAKAKCTFLSEDNYITREQIRNHAEILPPYFMGCGSKLTPKLPWENPGKSGWKSVVPEDGQYKVPDWRQFA